MINLIGTALNQWDVGRSVTVTESEATHVHFANMGDTKAVIMELVESQAKIPDYLLQTGKQLCVYAVANGVTIERRTFPVTKRERPEDYVYEEDQRNYIYELIAKAERIIEDLESTGGAYNVNLIDNGTNIDKPFGEVEKAFLSGKVVTLTKVDGTTEVRYVCFNYADADFGDLGVQQILLFGAISGASVSEIGVALWNGEIIVDGPKTYSLTSGGGGSVELDTTLTQEGKAADAKAVGDAIGDIESRVEALEPAPHPFAGKFESGTLYTGGWSVSYEDTNAVFRTKKGTAIALVEGDTISTKNNLKMRIVYVEHNTGGHYASYGYTTETFIAPHSGNYCMCFMYTDQRVITSIDEALNDVMLNEDISTLPKYDNEAKGVFSIMSYNVGGWYEGSGNRVPGADYDRFLGLQTSIIDRYKPDVLCVQEYADNVSATQHASFLNDRYHFVETARGYSNYDGKAICTNRQLIDSTNIAFTTIDCCNRNYQKAYVYMNGRKVCVISAHLALTDSVAVENATELLNAVANEDYFIICVDANVDCNDTSAELYQNTLKRFADLGYNLCNGGEFGVFNTYADIRYASTPLAVDNIITSANINIKSVVMDTQKEGLAEGTDHYPLVAYLEVF